MLLEKIHYLSRRDLVLGIRAMGIVPRSRPTKKNLEELFIASLAQFLNCAPMDLERCVTHELARIMDIKLGDDPQHWPIEVQNAMAARMYTDFLPFIQMAVAVAWSDGDFTQQEVEYLDLLFSGFKTLRRYRRHIVELATSPLSVHEFAKTMESISRDKAKWLLAFGWAMACADGNIHPRERSFLDRVGAHSKLSPAEHETLKQEIIQKWTAALQEDADPFEAAFKAVDMEKILKEQTGINPVELLRPRAWQRRRLFNRSHSAILSLTIFSKAGLITGKQLTQRDRTLLLLALVLVEA